MMRRSIERTGVVFSFLLFSTLFPVVLLAQSAPKPSAGSPREAALRAMFDVRVFQQAVISLDGNRLAWVESLPGPDGQSSANSAIYVVNVSEGALAEPKRVTASRLKDHEEHDVAWSTDSKRLAFLSDAGTPGQLQRVVLANSTVLATAAAIPRTVPAPQW